MEDYFINLGTATSFWKGSATSSKLLLQMLLQPWWIQTEKYFGYISANVIVEPLLKLKVQKYSPNFTSHQGFRLTKTAVFTE